MRNHNLPKYGSGALKPQGLYDPCFEHDACGVGMICHIKGEKSHRIIADGLQILVNLTHRGACGCDETTGDGAGILIQMPHTFIQKVSTQASITLPDEKEYASGLVFLPPDPKQRALCMNRFEAVVSEEAQRFLGWRRVPVASEALGDLARQMEPVIYQIFIGRGGGIDDPAHFERKLFVIRKVIERFVRESELPQAPYFHIPSLSSQTLVYKGMLLADQIAAFYADLSDPDMISALALVHQRYSTNTFPTWDLAHPFRFLCHNGEINTLRGNVNWMNARQYLFRSKLFGEDMSKLFPIATPGASDSAIFDNAVELLYHSGRSLPHAIMMMIPEAWQKHQTMDDRKKAFYEYHSCMRRTDMREVPDSHREWQADLVLIAMGFTGPEPDTVVESCGLKLDERGNIQTDSNYMSSVPGVFAAGDANRGQSLIVWAISEGREAARSVDAYLMGTSELPAKGGVDLPRI